MACIGSTQTRQGQIAEASAREGLAARTSGGRAERLRRAWHCSRLWVRVQADAFWLAPIVYLQAVAWRVRGLRVRSRNTIAALAGRSPSAYRYWISRREPELLKALLAEPVVPGPALIAVSGRSSVSEVADLVSTTGAWLCPVGPGDRLAPDAVDIYERAIAASPQTDIIYADDDLIDATGNRHEPHFKPDWNPDLFRHHDYLVGACAVHVRPEDLTGLSEDRWAEQLVGKALERGRTPVHLPVVLHHRTARPLPVPPRKPAHPIPRAAPLVSAIIPTRNQAALLRTCLDGLRAAAYPAVETIVIDNGSDQPEALDLLHKLDREGVVVLRMPGPFNYSRLNNEAAARAKGEYLCFLNNDVEMLDSDWLALLIRQALRPEIGAVGARLLYEDRTIQHAGVFTGIGGGAGHAHRFERADEPGYFGRSSLPQQVTAVTAACMAVAKTKFMAVGGFDEEQFPVAFNDVDLCLKLNARGWQAFYEPRATLIHHESKSRGNDSAKPNRVRFAGELAALKRGGTRTRAAILITTRSSARSASNSSSQSDGQALSPRRDALRGSIRQYRGHSGCASSQHGSG